MKIQTELDSSPKLVARIAPVVSKHRDLSSLAATLCQLFPRMLVYRGGCHVALHAKPGHGRRLAFITE